MSRELYILTHLVLTAACVVIAIIPALIIRHAVFKHPAPWWAGALIAVLTLFLGMGLTVMLLSGDRPGIPGLASVLAYFIITQRKQKNAGIESTTPPKR